MICNSEFSLMVTTLDIIKFNNSIVLKYEKTQVLCQ